MTKAQRILKLYDGKRTTREIGDIVGCRPEYVRVVARQRHGSMSSEIDKRYWASTLYRTRKRKWHQERCAEDPNYWKKRHARAQGSRGLA